MYEPECQYSHLKWQVGPSRGDVIWGRWAPASLERVGNLLSNLSFSFFWSQVSSSCKSLQRCLCNLLLFFWYVNSMNLQCSFLSHLLLAWGLIGFSGLALPAFDKGEILSVKWWLQIATLPHRVWLGRVWFTEKSLIYFKGLWCCLLLLPLTLLQRRFCFPSVTTSVLAVTSQGTCMVLVRGHRSWSVI